MNLIYLLDTNVVSEFLKPAPNAALMTKAADNRPFCAISATVWQELVYGHEHLPSGKRKERIGSFLANVKASYDILPYDRFASQICGELQARCSAAGPPAPFFDSQIAATAIANGMILVTHNTADYAALREHSMLAIEDWWK